jgi:hypothetical protein
MKRLPVLFSLLVFLAAPAFADWRIDIGFDIPRGMGASVDGEETTFSEATDFFSKYIIPLPEAGAYYFGETGPFRAGVGIRVFTALLVSVWWPNAFAELDFGRFVIAGQLGGGVFGTFGLVNDIQSGSVLIPDLSAWLKVGNVFRLGGGAVGVMLPEEENAVVFLYYLGAKFALKL